MGQRSSRSKRGRHGVRAGQTQRERELRQRVRDLRELVSKMADGATERAVQRLAQDVRMGKLEAVCRTVAERLAGVRSRLEQSRNDLCAIGREAGEHKQSALKVAVYGLAQTAMDQMDELSHVRSAIERAMDQPKAANAAPAQAGADAVKAGETKAENYALLC